MGLTSVPPVYRTIRASLEGEVCRLVLARPEHGNPIGRDLIDELGHALDTHESVAKVVILEGSPEVFCLGADFHGLQRDMQSGSPLRDHAPGPMYELWRRLASGPFVSVAHVRGKVNAGGVGFVAACDIVLSEERATFSLSELMFGLTPACVLPFLVRRIGLARANYLTLSTQPIPAGVAQQWGLVDACEEDSNALLRRHLVRLNRLSKPAIVRHKRYADQLDDGIVRAQPAALTTNSEAFTDPVNLQNIGRYVTTGRFPWEAGP